MKEENSGDQFVTLMDGYIHSTSANFTWTIQDGVKIGSIHIHVSSTFVGTTATILLLGSNDGSNFGTVYRLDETTPVSFTLAANDNKIAELLRVSLKYYRLVYDKGDASAGTIDANFIGKK